jgi:Flp pilus assembly protein TadG
MTHFKVKKVQNGGALVEAVIIFPIVVLLVLGIMQLALIAHAMSILDDAAQAAARAVAVGRSAQIAASYVCLPLASQGMPSVPIVSISRKTVQDRHEKITATVTYNLKVVFPSFKWLGINKTVFGTFGLPYRPLRATCTILREPQESDFK